MIATNKKVKYQSTGVVYGRYWGGGEGAYRATPMYGATKEELLAKANNALAIGSLDGGMGYERLLGAKLDIATITTVEIEGKTFENIEYEMEFIEIADGALTEDAREFLEFEVEM